METGEIYKWTTNRALGYLSREKYHVFIDKDQHGKSVFLFINSESKFKECDFEINNMDYPFFTKPLSYINCTSPVKYSDNDIQHLPHDNHHCGTLKKIHIEALVDHVERSDVLEAHYIKLISNALRKILS